MSAEYRTALLRALLAAIPTAFLTFFTLIAQTDDWRLLVSATGVSFWTPFVLRFGVEGSVDHRAARRTVDMGSATAIWHRHPEPAGDIARRRKDGGQ